MVEPGEAAPSFKSHVLHRASESLANAPVRRVVALALLFTLVPLLVLAYSSVHLATVSLRTEAKAKARVTAAVSAAEVQREMTSLGQLVTSYANRSQVQAAFTLGQAPGGFGSVQQHLDDLRSARLGIVTTFATDDSGKLVGLQPQTAGLLGTSFSHRDWFIGTTASRRGYISEVYRSAGPGGSTVVAAAAPIWARVEPGAEPRLAGVLGASYGLTETEQFVRRIAESENLLLTVTDQKGVVVVSARRGVESLSSIREDPLVTAALAGASGVTTADLDGDEAITAYTPINGLGWTLTASVPERVALAPVGEIRRTVYGVTALITVVLLSGVALLAAFLRERSRIENALAVSEAEIRGTLEASKDAFVSMDASGTITRWSRQAEELFGWTGGEAVGRRVGDTIVPPELRAAHQAGMKRYMATGKGDVIGRRIEIDALHKDGHTFPVELAIWNATTEKGTLFSAFLHDITDRRVAAEALVLAHDEALESTRLKSAFLANMSHEIRTPMNGVVGMSGLLTQTDLTAEQSGYVQTVRNSAEALLTVIDDILDFSKIEAGKLELESIDFEIRTVMNEVGEVLSESARRKGLELVVDIQPDVATTLSGDPGRLRQALLNLAGNALKFTAEGKVVIGCRVEERKDGTVLLRLEVTDTGPGIVESQQAEIFDSFSQADVSTTRKYGGTGLGLAITKQLAQLMDGDVGVESRVGRGSTFWFTARFEERSDPSTDKASSTVAFGAPTAGSDVPVGSGPPGAGATVGSTLAAHLLVAEDNDINQQVAVKSLEKMGYTSDVVADGEQAIAAVASRDYAAVLMDCQMPKVDGLNAARAIRAMSGTKGSIPIIAVTASAMAEDRAECLDAGMDDFIAKPVKWSELERVLRRWVPVGTEEEGTLSPPYADDGNGVLDPQMVSQLRNLTFGPGGAESLRLLTEEFLRRSDERLKAMREALGDADATDASGVADLSGVAGPADLSGVAGIAHNLRGSVGVYGATTATDLCLRIENMAVAGNRAETTRLLGVLEREMATVRAAVEAAFLTPPD